MLENLEWIPLVEHYKLPSASGLYLIRGPSGKLYAGKSKNIRKRLSDHRYSANRGSTKATRSTKISRAIKKHGVSNFQTCVYLLVSDVNVDLNSLEVKLIAELDLQTTGYNITAGGEGTVGRKCSEAYLKYLSERGRGKKHTDEHKRKIRETSLYSAQSRRGVPRSEAVKAKIREACTLRVYYPTGPMSADRKSNISRAKKGKMMGGNNPKAMVALLWEPGSFTPKFFESGRDLARFLGRPYKAVSNWLSGKYTPRCGTVCCYEG